MKRTTRAIPPSRDAFAAYCHSLSRVPPCTAEEAIELARKFRAGDAAAGRRLVEGNLRFAVKLARGMLPKSRAGDLDELIQEANFGLLQARDHFDPERGVRFASYAAWWIRAAVLRYLLQTARLVRIGKTKASREEFYSGRTPFIEVSIDAAVPGTDLELADMLTGGDRPDDLVEAADLYQRTAGRLAGAAARLPPRELDIYQKRWQTEESVTLDVVGRAHGVSRERARQIEVRMLERLREELADAA